MPNDSWQWPLPSPHVIEWQIQESEIDHYQHVNNANYVSKLELVSWHHSNRLGLTIEQYQQLDRGMAISRHEIDYLSPAILGDTLLCATWIVECDRRLKLARQFQFQCASSHKVVLNARTEFVCIALSSGKPKRMPALFADTYGAAMITSDVGAIP